MAGWLAGYNSADWLNAGLMTDCLAGGLMLAGYNSAGVRMADWLTGCDLARDLLDD